MRKQSKAGLQVSLANQNNYSYMTGPIGEVFVRNVLGSSELRRLRDSALESIKEIDLPAFDGSRFGPERVGIYKYWPINADRIIEYGRPRRGHDQEDCLAFRVGLAKQVRAFFEPLRQGYVVGQGISSAGNLTEIPATFWNSSNACFQPQDNDLSCFSDDPPHGWSPRPQGSSPANELRTLRALRGCNGALSVLTPIWRCVTLSVSVGVEGCYEPMRGAGRKPKFLWESAFEKLVIRLGEEGHPDTGAQLARMMCESFSDLGAKSDEVPDENYIQKWLRENYRELWNHVVKGREKN